jgi:hypothetical protein
VEFYCYRDTEHLALTGDLLDIHIYTAEQTCKYCAGVLRGFVRFVGLDQSLWLLVCVRCGWWKQKGVVWGGGTFAHQAAVLKKFGKVDDTVPINDIKRALAQNWSLHKTLSAKRAEEIVAAIFAEVMEAEILYLTNRANAPDRGIDFVLASRTDGQQIAFQVKRRLTSRKEGIQEVRAFLGALALSPFQRGFYVTTAEGYSAAVHKELGDASVNLQGVRHLELDLVQGDQLREMLLLNRPLGSSLERLVQQVRERGWDSDWLKFVPGPGSFDARGKREKLSDLIPPLMNHPRREDS